MSRVPVKRESVTEHRSMLTLTLADAGTAIAIARRVPLENVTLAERKASLFVDVARACIQWGRYEHDLRALRTGYAMAPEEIRRRPAVQRIAGELARAPPLSATTASTTSLTMTD